MPRKYSMERRTASTEETRQRIIDATVQLHDEQGIGATTMQEIAGRAGVALGTVYRHFPTLEELVPACGGRNMEMYPPPTPEVFAGFATAEERFQTLIGPLYAHYKLAERKYEVGFAEAPSIPVLQGMMQQLAEYTAGLVQDAMAPGNPTDETSKLALALGDFHAWKAFSRAGLQSDSAARLAGAIVAARLQQGVSP